MMKKFYISFDDTDNLESPGTGHVLNKFLEMLPCESSFISRHQLFVNKDVPYTSHNSAMCSVVQGQITREELICRAVEYLEETLAPGADPGLCVADPDEIVSPELLVKWGYRAKKEVLTKNEAYELARSCGVHLSEHGGTGQGVVGALAAVGLRLAGQDGRVKGKKAVQSEILSVAELLAQTGFERVSCYGRGELPADAVIHTNGDRIKAVYQNFSSTVLVVPRADHYVLLGKDHLKCF